jgi:hypothetical protein
MSTISYDDETINKLIKYLNPERESFKEFIFRDSNGLYKYNGIYPSLVKQYLDISDNYNFENTCELIRTKEKNIKLCHKLLFDAILNMNSSNVRKVLTDIKEITNISPLFFDIAKEEIIKIDHKIVISLLKNLNFKIYEEYDNNYLKKNIKLFTNTTIWLETLDNTNKNIVLKIPLFIDYLQLLVDFINDNISILNENLTEFHLDFMYMKKLEDYLSNTYNKNLIYNDIISGYINKYSHDNELINKFYKQIIINEKEKNYIFTNYLFRDLFKNYQNNLINVNIDSVKRKILGLLINYKRTEESLFKYLSNLVKYIMLDKKINNISDIKDNLVGDKFVLNEKYLIKEFDLFLRLKQHLINTQYEFMKKYPKKNFYK